MSDEIYSKTPLSPRLARKARFAAWLHKHVPRAYEAWTMAGVRKWRQSDVPWTPIGKRLDACRVGLVSSGGFVLPDQEPFDLNDPTGDCSYRVIANDADITSLRVSHAFYDSRAAKIDADVAFPIRALNTLIDTGRIATAASRHVSFSGSIPDPTELESDYAPEVADLFASDEVDLVLLTPA